MTKIMLVLLMCIHFSCLSQEIDRPDFRSLIKELSEAEFQVYKDLGKVPKSFFRFINRHGWNLSMVNYGKQYNKTDIAANHLPNSMLIELGISKNNLYVLLFDQGGYSVTRRAFLFRKVKKRFIVKDFLLDPSIDSIEKLKEGIIKD